MPAAHMIVNVVSLSKYQSNIASLRRNPTKIAKKFPIISCDIGQLRIYVPCAGDGATNILLLQVSSITMRANMDDTLPVSKSPTSPSSHNAFDTSSHVSLELTSELVPRDMNFELSVNTITLFQTSWIMTAPSDITVVGYENPALRWNALEFSDNSEEMTMTPILFPISMFMSMGHQIGRKTLPTTASAVHTNLYLKFDVSVTGDLALLVNDKQIDLINDIITTNFKSQNRLPKE